MYRGDVLTAGTRGHEVQADARVLAGEREPFQHANGSGVTERVGEVLGEQQPHSASLAGTQRPRDGVGAGVAESAGRFQHAAAQLG